MYNNQVYKRRCDYETRHHIFDSRLLETVYHIINFKVFKMALFSICVGAVALGLGYWLYRNRQKNIPPGPTPIPVFGNFLALMKFRSMGDALIHYQKEYGNMFTLHLGSRRTIILCGHEMIREGLISNADNLSERPNDFLTHTAFGKGIVWDAHNWKENRKFTLLALRDFGLGKRSLEEMVYLETEQFCSYLTTIEGKVTELKPIMMKVFSNVICSIVFGDRFDYDNAKFNKLVDMLGLFFAKMGAEASLIDNIPWLQYVPYYRTKYNELVKINADTEAIIKEVIEEHKESYDPENIRDFIDLYLQTDSTNERTAMVIIKELFFAGTETSGTTLSWVFLLLAKYPKMQERCHQEIRKVIGTGRGPKISDRGSLPYTEATLQEISRLKSIVPLALPHRVKEDMMFKGHLLPKDTIVVPFLDSAHHNPDVWSDHNEFKPERWLNEAGEFDAKHPAYMPFSVGRRSCLGEQLAKVELFVVFTSVLQKFKFMPPPGEEISLEGHLGMTYSPVNSRLVFRKVE